MPWGNEQYITPAIPMSTEVKAQETAALKGLYVGLRDARDGGYKVRVKAGKDVDGWFYVMAVNETDALLLGRYPTDVRLKDIMVLVEDEAGKRVNRELDMRRGA